MTEELGKIEKPEAQPFKVKRKVYLVPLVNVWEGAPDEYQEKFERYWIQVREQLNKLETRLGEVSRIYHEAIYTSGEDSIKAIEKMNKKSAEITRARCEQKATLEAAEDRELTAQSLDWEGCLMLPFRSEQVARQVQETYLEASRRRYKCIAHQIDTTLQEGEAGLLFIHEGHGVQFPADVEVFNISPPVLDEIHRWFRDQVQRVSPPEPPSQHNEH